MNFLKNLLKQLIFQEKRTPTKIGKALFFLYIVLAIHIFKAGIVDFGLFQSAIESTSTYSEAGLYIVFFSLPPIILFYLIQKIQNRSLWARNVFAFITLFLMTLNVLLLAYPIFAHKVCVSRDLLNVLFYMMLIPAKGDAAFVLLSLYNLFHKDSKTWFHQPKAQQTVIGNA